MPRISHLAAACALALCAQAAQAQQFSGVISFGDSLSDAGNASTVNPGAADGNSFTTNDDLVAAQLIAAAYGFNQQHSLIGGTNYAWGGSCAQSSTAPAPLPPHCVQQPFVGLGGVTYFPRLDAQIDQYLASNAGRANPNALFTVLSGANDIFAAITGERNSMGVVTRAPIWTNSALISAGSAGVAGAVITNVARLQSVGANYIVVFNLPDLGRTPQFSGTAAPFNLASVSYNEALNAGLAGRQGIIPVNTFALVNEAIANPGYFGFTNVVGIACGANAGAVGIVGGAARVRSHRGNLLYGGPIPEPDRRICHFA